MKPSKRSVAIKLLPLFLFIMCTCLVFDCMRMIAVSGHSMEPTYSPGDAVICARIYSNPKVGEVILFIMERDGKSVFLIKRVAALPGQTVQIDPATGAVYVDGIPFPSQGEAPRADSWQEKEAWPGAYAGAPLTVPDGYIFVLGDNRAVSIDSRDEAVGLVPCDHIWGTVVFHIPRRNEL